MKKLAFQEIYPNVWICTLCSSLEASAGSLRWLGKLFRRAHIILLKNCRTIHYTPRWFRLVQADVAIRRHQRRQNFLRAGRASFQFEN